MPDPYEWQVCHSLAEALGVCTRTIRLWVGKGKTEKTRADGKVLYRLVRKPPEVSPAPETLPTPAVEPPKAVVSVVSMADYKQHISELYERIIKAEVEVAELRLLADVAVRDAEREAERADQLEEDADRLRESKEEMTRKYWSGVRRMR